MSFHGSQPTAYLAVIVVNDDDFATRREAVAELLRRWAK